MIRPSRLVKRAWDVIGAGAGLVMLAPAMTAVAAVIRLDSPGPAFFTQDRVGKDGRVFRLYKFRTMTSGAPVQFNPDGSTRVEVGDMRVTRIGRHLRGALDELPQLLNVLKGDMSLVGPRPDMPVHAGLYTERESEKLRVRPGMTSLAAVLGRNDIPWKQRIAIDLDYVQNWSLALDARVLLATASVLVLRRQPFDFSDVTGYRPPAKDRQ